MGVNRLAARATNHCLTGCGIGETLGMVLATWWGWRDAASIALATVLAIFFGYLLGLPRDLARRRLGPTFLVNRALIARGKGHARAHAAHGHAY